MSLCGLHRRLRGALVGQFATVELTSSPGSDRLVRAMRRLGCPEPAIAFYDEHVEADAVHEQIVRHGVIAPLLAAEPHLAATSCSASAAAASSATASATRCSTRGRSGRSDAARPAARRPGARRERAMTRRPVAVVTGASRGLGFLLARELADRGHDLVVNARSESGLAVAAAACRSAAPQVVTVPGDVADPALGQQLVDTATERFGRLDVLVTNAGSIQVGPAFAMRAQDFANAMDLMFYGVLHPVLAALPVMKERGAGRILVISSIGGKLPAPHLLPYVAAKHAAVGFAEGLRVEAIRHGITVTCAVPGLMRTGSPRNALFTGDQAGEHRWFTLGDSLPLVSMDAERAARQLVAAALKGKPEVAPHPAGEDRDAGARPGAVDDDAPGQRGQPAAAERRDARGPCARATPSRSRRGGSTR